MWWGTTKPVLVWLRRLKLQLWFMTVSVAIGIPLQPPAYCDEVKQLRPWSVLGWVTVVVCQVLLIVLRMRH